MSLPVLDTLQTYLLVINLSALLLNAWHYALRRLDGRERVSDAVRTVLSAAGGAAGTIVALVIWDLRPRKENSWQHVLAVSSLVIWGVICGFIYVCPPDPATFATKLLRRRDTLCLALGVLSLVTFVVFGIDKWRAAKDCWRIPEAVLLGLSAIGGCVGGLVGMLVFRHKVRSPQFAVGLPLLLVAQLMAAAYAINAGLL